MEDSSMLDRSGEKLPSLALARTACYVPVSRQGPLTFSKKAFEELCREDEVNGGS